MADVTQPPERPRTRWQRFRSWAGGLAAVFGVVILALLIAEIPAVRDLCAQIDAAQEASPWLIAIPIAMMVVGGVLMLGAQFLPAPRQPTPPTNEALDGAAVPMEYAEARGRRYRTMEMEATAGQVREAWRRRSWRYSSRWRTFFLMMLGAVLVAAGLTLLFILIGEPWIKVLMAGLFGFFAVRILWEFAVR